MGSVGTVGTFIFPEPSTLGMLLAGLLCLGWRVWRRR
ncbi:MAG: PEP-CTERM sorting domain-containing protein [Pirellulales bacterium]|nr:PEP-CTERM sorting domain-containing protein [Pirellulales bacterium]